MSRQPDCAVLSLLLLHLVVSTALGTCFAFHICFPQYILLGVRSTMRHSAAFFCLIAVSPVTQAIAFGVPAPTAVNPQRALNGNIPEPTHNPSAIDLRNRQANFNQETCGWVDGNYSMLSNLMPALSKHLLTCTRFRSELPRSLDLHALQIWSSWHGWMLQRLRLSRLWMVECVHGRQSIRSR
jgi:hypothetical protein